MNSKTHTRQTRQLLRGTHISNVSSWQEATFALWTGFAHTLEGLGNGRQTLRQRHSRRRWGSHDWRSLDRRLWSTQR